MYVTNGKGGGGVLPRLGEPIKFYLSNSRDPRLNIYPEIGTQRLTIEHETFHGYYTMWRENPAQRPSVNRVEQLWEEDVSVFAEAFRREHADEVVQKLEEIQRGLRQTRRNFLADSVQQVIDGLGNPADFNGLAIDRRREKTPFYRLLLPSEMVRAIAQDRSTSFSKQQKEELELQLQNVDSQLADANERYKQYFDEPYKAID
jgi:hypothetical protein